MDLKLLEEVVECFLEHGAVFRRNQIYLFKIVVRMDDASIYKPDDMDL